MRARWMAPILVVMAGCSLLVDTGGLDEAPPNAGDASSSDAAAPTTDAGADSPHPTPGDDDDDDAGLDADADAGPALPRIVGDWPFDDGTGTLLTDVSGRDHHGLIFGAGEWVADRAGTAGHAYELKVSSDYISVAASSDFDRPENASFSMAAWMRTSEACSHDMFFAVKLGNNNAFGLELLSSTELTYYDGDNHVGTSTVPNVVGPWHHYALVVEGNVVRLYFDGVRVGQGTPSTRSRKAGPVLFGGYHSGERLVGAIDQARFFRVALTDAEVLAEKNR
ncbi:MAG: LamG domain-containing protein [Labilithrix sp.]|nr:LamG domain-containing protein [Labilithrix sp.]